jgi:hypothetical protein
VGGYCSACGPSVSTVKRYEKKYGMPTLRFCNGRPMAFKEERDFYFLKVDEAIRKYIDEDGAKTDEKTKP